MTEPSEGGIHIDSDWKEEARLEKERLTQAESAAKPESSPAASFAELVNLVVMQAAMSLGGFAGPSGEQVPPDLSTARHYVDLLGLLQEKTSGNLSEQEKKMLETVLHELRMQFVQSAGAGASPSPSPSPDAQPKIETP